MTVDEARDAARTMLASIRLGRNPADERRQARDQSTLAEFAERYLSEEATAKLKPQTLANYRTYLHRHALPVLGSRKIDAIEAIDIFRLHRKIGQEKPVVANRVVECLASVFRYAAICGLVPKNFNPTADVGAFRERPRDRYLTEAELGRLGKALQKAETVGLDWRPVLTKSSKHVPKSNQRTVLSPHVTAAVRLLLFTGWRLREVLHLQWEGIDFGRGVALHLDTKTGRRYAILSAPALAVLSELSRIGPYVIPGDKAGKPRSDLNRPWRAIRAEAELDGVRLHDLRHTHGAFGAGLGLGLPIIGKLLGHSQAQSTLRYSHLADDPLRRASNRVGETIAAALAGTESEVFNLRNNRAK